MIYLLFFYIFSLSFCDLQWFYGICFRCSYDASPPQGDPETLQKPGNLQTSQKIAGMLLFQKEFNREVASNSFPILEGGGGRGEREAALSLFSLDFLEFYLSFLTFLCNLPILLYYIWFSAAFYDFIISCILLYSIWISLNFV